MKPDSTPETTTQMLEAEVNEALNGERLDQVAAKVFPDYSRARLQEWIKQGFLQVNGASGKAKQKVHSGDLLTLNPVLAPQGDWEAEDLPLNIVFEDEQVLVVNKAANVVVHPGAGNPSGTLLNALLYHRPELATLPRGGIVHRLDKDTTGLMVIAKTLLAHQDLVNQLQERTVGRHYYAIVNGMVQADGSVNASMGRHPIQRKKMAVVKSGGKEAITHYQVKRRFQRHTLLKLKLETGRTHQIRVHMQSIGHALVGDQTYGGRARVARQLTPELNDLLRTFSRQALHAGELQLIHPVGGESMAWKVGFPEDLSALIEALGDG